MDFVYSQFHGGKIQLEYVEEEADEKIEITQESSGFVESPEKDVGEDESSIKILKLSHEISKMKEELASSL